ncbi:MaoC family dehydratase [Halocatena pleomorpha]|uniref:MaoC family dehydratase n=1 Tax=Halocatena pleomorpha TaxID=1785090 RepID=A0A3P3R629_9EURY|nr:MaoC family dehydratase [Halocatena pleomorpha]RRJ28438.1 MaoC family dehydratase [Halocatena pleomorpha]
MLSGYYEDIEIGTTQEFGSYTVEKEELVSFAEQYDPQPFHVDESAAEESLFGELVASGWHTAAMTMRMLVDNSSADSRAMGAVGVDELRWKEPVRPGDTLSVRTEVIDKEPWDDALGLISSRTTVFAGDTEVMAMTGRVLYQRRAE